MSLEKNIAQSHQQPSHTVTSQLEIGAKHGPLKIEADIIADRIMRMPENGLIQRKCSDCEEEEHVRRKPLTSYIQKRSAQGMARTSGQLSKKIAATRGKGTPLSYPTKSFMESRFGTDFSNVKIHKDNDAQQMSRELKAQAFTVGNDIYFNAGKFAPETAEGKHLLAHELTHTIQQSNPANPIKIQRTIHNGNDHGGRFTVDDDTCEMDYYQRWYFNFLTAMTQAEKINYMQVAKDQIDQTWSGQHQLIPDNAECPCSPAGINVNVHMTPTERGRRGARGFTVTVYDNERAHVNPVTRDIALDRGDDQLQSFDPTASPMPVIAHEFGHAIGLPDEYNGWASFFNTGGSRDRPSLMHFGANVQPRHYQPFADLVNFTIGSGCTYYPDGVRLPHLSNLLNRWSAFPGAGLPPANIDFMLGLNYDRRVSNSALLGLMYPSVGQMSIWNPEDRSVTTGPTVGLSLNSLAHPLYWNIRTGLLFDPSEPDRSLNIPISTDLGIETEGFRVGVNYTGLFDILNQGQYTHIIGVGLNIDL